MRTSFLAFLVAGATAAGLTSQHHLYTWAGDAPYDLAGVAVRGVGDLNKDGWPDVAIGAPLDDGSAPDAGSVSVFSGRDGTLLRRWRGRSAGDRFGASVGAAGDVDGDGHADVVAGALHESANGTAAGSARIFSGRTGAELFVFHGDSAYDFFGVAVAGAGDVDNDGRPDVIVGAYGDDDAATDAGSASVYSGRTGKLLHEFRGGAAGDLFGRSVDGAGDLNGDGHADLIIGAYGADGNGKDAGRADLVSGRDGKLLRSWTGRGAGDGFGYAVAGGGDIDRDGVPDLVVGAPFDDDRGESSGSVWILSGKTGSVLFTRFGERSGDFLGISVSGAGDVDQDGHADMIAGAQGHDGGAFEAGSAFVYTGKTGRRLYTFHGNSRGDLFGVSVSAAGDVNRDGHADVVAGAWHDDIHGAKSGSATVFSGASLAFTSGAHTVSLARGGAARFSLSAGNAQAGKAYLLLGSLRGTRPGIRLGPVTLPLNPDAWLGFLAGHPNTVIANSRGLLDSAGHATATLRLAPGLPPSLAGTRMHHAYVVLAWRGSFDFASNARPLTLVK